MAADAGVLRAASRHATTGLSDGPIGAPTLQGADLKVGPYRTPRYVHARRSSTDAPACLAAAAFTLRLRDEMVDFEVYRTAGGRAAAGEPLYREPTDTTSSSIFAPFALMLTPFATLPGLQRKASGLPRPWPSLWH